MKEILGITLLFWKKDVRGNTVVFSQLSSNKTNGVTLSFYIGRHEKKLGVKRLFFIDCHQIKHKGSQFHFFIGRHKKNIRGNNFFFYTMWSEYNVKFYLRPIDVSDSVVQCIECLVIGTEVCSSSPAVNWGGGEKSTQQTYAWHILWCKHVSVIIIFNGTFRALF